MIQIIILKIVSDINLNLVAILEVYKLKIYNAFQKKWVKLEYKID